MECDRDAGFLHFGFAFGRNDGSVVASLRMTNLWNEFLSVMRER